jgi:tRNA1(Val) A37 N6-methylase TrmN6
VTFLEILKTNQKYNHLNLSSVASHVLEHINQPNSQHAINMDSIFLLKEVRKPGEHQIIERREYDGNVN